MTTPTVLLNDVIDLILDAICAVDAEGRFVYVSAASQRIFGYAPEEMVGRRMLDLVHPDDRSRTQHIAEQVMAGVQLPHFENRYVRKDGRVVHVMWSARWSEQHGLRIGVARDVTERKRAEALQAALYAISEAAHAAEDLLALFGQVHRIVDRLLPADNFFVALYDSELDELSFPYFVDQYDPPPPAQRLASGTLSAEVIRRGQPLLLTHDKRHLLPETLRAGIRNESVDWLGVPLIAQGQTIGALVVQSYTGKVRYTEDDLALLQFVSSQVATVIERKRMEERLRHLARHDQLTGLPNRQLFHERLQSALRTAQGSDRRLALLYLDLDRFKYVNDTLGHAAGDLLLQQVAQRLRHNVSGMDTVGRVGGDEFVVLLDGVGHPHDALAAAERIRSVLDQPFSVFDRRLKISASVGVALYPEHGDEHTQLLRLADEAMYRAKSDGGNRHQMIAARRILGEDLLPPGPVF